MSVRGGGAAPGAACQLCLAPQPGGAPLWDLPAPLLACVLVPLCRCEPCACACACACAQPGPGKRWRVCARRGRPSCASLPGPRSFLGTDTLPPSAQGVQSPAGAGPGASGSPAGLLPPLVPSTPPSRSVLAAAGGNSWGREGGGGVDTGWSPRAGDMWGTVWNGLSKLPQAPYTGWEVGMVGPARLGEGR